MMAASRIDPSAERAAGPMVVPDVPADASSAQLLSALGGLARELFRLDIGECEADLSRVLPIARDVELVLQRTLRHLQALERLTQVGDDANDVGLDFEPETVVGLRITAPVQARLCDVCFAGVLELNRVAREIARAKEQEELLAATETAVRKLRRAIRAVLQLAHETGASELAFGDHLREQGGSDLEATLAVRRLYAEFRRALRRPENAEPAAVLTALRYAAGALASLISSASYAGARVSDRALLRRLQQRLLSWARGDKPVDRGLELLDDVWTCADLLRGINRRQELRVHDGQLLRELCAGTPNDPAAWLARSTALHGLDDELDALLLRAQQTSRVDGIPEILARLRLVTPSP